MKGIMFNHEQGMWSATITGKKTNTRRIERSLNYVNNHPNDWVKRSFLVTDEEKIGFRLSTTSGRNTVDMDVYPRHQHGDILYLQEPTLKCERGAQNVILYRYPDADGRSDLNECKALVKHALDQGEKWTNKMFMPSARARYFIEITAVKLERLQDISQADCFKEGIDPTSADPKGTYRQIFEKIHSADAWKKNPWVFSYHYKITLYPHKKI